MYDIKIDKHGYIKAFDEQGNKVASGFTFNQVERELDWHEAREEKKCAESWSAWQP